MTAEKSPLEALVFVLGDIGHSPRTVNSILSLAECDQFSTVHVLAYKKSKSALDRNDSRIRLHLLEEGLWNWFMPAPGTQASRLYYLLASVVKVLVQCVLLVYLLLFKVQVYRVHLLWCQVPPAIPTLPLLAVVRCILMPLAYLLRLRPDNNYAWIIDWHNLGYSILQVSNRPRFLVLLAEFLEKTFGCYADAHLCVSQAFKSFLQTWLLPNSAQTPPPVIVLYDKPTKAFKDRNELTLAQRHNLFKRLPSCCSPSTGASLFTRKKGSSSEYLSQRPALIVSSTSWTPDEDFSILLNAIQEYDALHKNDSYPHLHFVITGKGPQKEYYLNRIEKMGLTKCTIQTAWLDIEDYPLLLACADLGVCMHYSSSQVDLPMKVVDMFAAGLPVCAIQYKALDELVKHQKNGYIFQDSEELTRRFESLFKNFPQNTTVLDSMRKHIQQNFQKTRWDDEWRDKIVESGVLSIGMKRNQK